jgi:hypothetical protein
LRKTAAEFRSVEHQVISKDIEERRIGFSQNTSRRAIHADLDLRHEATSLARPVAFEALRIGCTYLPCEPGTEIIFGNS